MVGDSQREVFNSEEENTMFFLEIPRSKAILNPKLNPYSTYTPVPCSGGGEEWYVWAGGRRGSVENNKLVTQALMRADVF